MFFFFLGIEVSFFLYVPSGKNLYLISYVTDPLCSLASLTTYNALQ